MQASSTLVRLCEILTRRQTGVHEHALEAGVTFADMANLYTLLSEFQRS